MRIRWYGFQTELEASIIASLLRQMPYESGSSDGFLVEQLRPNFLEGSLIQRLQTTHQTIDPFGHAEEFELVEYLRSRFRMNIGTFSLELRDPGRTGSRLVSRLLEALGHRFSIEELSVDPLAWATKFREISGTYGMIERVQIGSVAIAENTVGQLLVKGTGDIVDAAIKFVFPARYSFEKVQLRFHTAKKSISFQRNASVVLSSDFDDQWIDVLRESLHETRSYRNIEAT